MDKVYRLMKWNRWLGSHRLKFAAIWAAHVLKRRHLFVRCDPVMGCNLDCAMCYFSDPDYRRQHKGRLTLEDYQRIGDLLFSRTYQLVIGCAAEPSLHPAFTELVALAKRSGIPAVGLVTNGQRLGEEHLTALLDAGLDELTVSVHGVIRKTYERFMVGASYERLHQMLHAFSLLKRERGARRPSLRLNYTVNSENLAELERFFEVYGRYEIRTIQLRPIMEFGGRFNRRLEATDLDRYRRVVRELRAECHRQEIVLLANAADPRYESLKGHHLVLDGVYRYVSPEVVWKEDFRWREETYDDYCRRIGWSRHLLKLALSRREDLEHAASFRQSLKYEIYS